MFAGIGMLCALICRAAVYALPMMVGVWAGFAALHSGSGPILGFAVGFVVGAIVFGIGQSVWNSRQPKALRFVVALLFVLPAVWTGYCAAQQILIFVVPSPSWQIGAAVLGAIAVGLTAFIRLAGGTPVLNWIVTRDGHI